MLYNKYIVLTVVCFFTFARGAADDLEHKKEKSLSDAHLLQLKNCFSLGKLVAIGLPRNHATFMVGKLSEDANVLMGCAGVVDGPDAAQIAVSIEKLVIEDRKWIPIGPENKPEDATRKNRARERAYLLSATNNRPKIVCASFVWFEITEADKGPLEVRKDGTFEQLREKILPFGVEDEVRRLKKQNVENPLERIAKEAEDYGFAHEAICLNFDHARYAELLKKVFGKEPSPAIDALVSQSEK